MLADADAQQRHADALARFITLLGTRPAGRPRGAFDAQCTEAAADITVLTAMLEARPLMADIEHIHALLAAIAPSVVWPPREFFPAKREELRLRHARFGDTAR